MTKKLLGAVMTMFFVVFWMFGTIEASACEGPVTETTVPTEVASAAEYYSSMYGIDVNLILAIIYTESSYNPLAQNGTCKGLMQVNTSVHSDIIENKGITDIWDTQQNICCGCMVLYNIIQDTDGDIDAVVLMKYNGDSTGLKRYYQTGEISSYADKVLTLQRKLDHEKSYR